MFRVVICILLLFIYMKTVVDQLPRFWKRELNVFRVGVLCGNLYSFVVCLYVFGSESITSVGEERANLSAVVYL